MKKFYVFAAVAIAALASCTKSEVVYNQGQQEIGFRQFTGSMTKTNTNLSELVGGPTTMGVFAHINASNPYKEYFSNAKFEMPTSGNVWGGNPKRYWPIKDELDFTLYAPYVADEAASYAKNKLTVTVANNTTTQQDFMYGTQRYIAQKKAASVPVVLKHALSKVSVKITSNVDNLFIVPKVEMVTPIQNGSFVGTYGDATSIAMDPGSTKGTVETYSGPEKAITSSSLVDFGSKLVFPLAPIAATNEAPNEVTNAAQLRITYNMESAIGLIAEAPLSEKWASGMHYTYNVTLTANKIVLTQTVEGWIDVTESHDPKDIK